MAERLSGARPKNRKAAGFVPARAAAKKDLRNGALPYDGGSPQVRNGSEAILIFRLTGKGQFRKNIGPGGV